MPESKKSGQPMDAYAGGPGFAGPMGGNASPANASDAMPLTGEKEAHGLDRYGVHDWRGAIADTGKHKGHAESRDRGSESMADTSGPH